MRGVSPQTREFIQFVFDFLGTLRNGPDRHALNASKPRARRHSLSFDTALKPNVAIHAKDESDNQKSEVPGCDAAPKRQLHGCGSGPRE